MKKRSIAFLMAIAMLFSEKTAVLASEPKLPGAEGQTVTTPEEAFMTYQGEEEYQVKSIEESYSAYSVRNSLPDSYESPYVTSVKNQNPYGSCWAFATMAASEASLVSSGMYGKNEIDLSEWHLAYFMAHPVTDPLGETAGDAFTLLYDAQSPNYMQRGGNSELASRKLANWQGPVKEDAAPYTKIKSVTNDMGTDAELDAQASLSDALAFQNEVHLENAWYISMKDRDIVKSLIQEYGAAATSYYHDSQYLTSQSSDGRPALYNPEVASTNHAITLVGWDDTFSKENFKVKPTDDGAWLCKNSWGNWGKDGYLWISYEDLAINSKNAVFFQYGEKDNYEHNYQYDGGLSSAYYPVGYSANVFEAKDNEVLKAVGFYTRDPGYNCSVSVYMDCPEGEPASGRKAVCMENVEETYAGYHTVELDTEVFLKKGSRFSVVISCEAQDGSSVSSLVDCEANGTWYKNQVSAKAGESFISRNGRYWQDVGADNENCRIKAFTRSPILTTSVSLNSANETILMGDTLKLSVSISPDNASFKEVQWSSSDPNVADVDNEGLVTAKTAGRAVITAEAADGSGAEASCEITVEKKGIKVSKITLNKTTETLTEGESSQLTAAVSPMDADNQELEWESSDVSVAKVDVSGLVTAQKPGTAVITATAKDGSGICAECEITVEKRKENGSSGNSGEGGGTGTTSPSKPDDTSSGTEQPGTGQTETNPTESVSPEPNPSKPEPSESETEQTENTDISAVKIDRLSISSISSAIAAGKKVNLTVTVYPQNASNPKVTWKTGNKKYANVNSKGVVTTKKAGKGKTVKITAEAKDGSGKKAVYKIKIMKNAVTNVQIKAPGNTLKAGKSMTLKATVRTNGKNANKSLKWTVSNTKYASVNSRGKVTAKKAGKGKTVTVTAMSTDGTNKKAKVKIKIS